NATTARRRGSSAKPTARPTSPPCCTWSTRSVSTAPARYARATTARSCCAAAHPAGAPLLVALRHGAGRVVVAADSDLFGDDVLGEFDHLQLWLNLLYWVALPAFRAEPQALVSAARQDIAWEKLR